MSLEKAKKLRQKLKEAGTKGMTTTEMGELFYGGEDILSDRDEIYWVWEKRVINNKECWVKVCRLREFIVD